MADVDPEGMSHAMGLSAADPLSSRGSVVSRQMRHTGGLVLLRRLRGLGAASAGDDASGWLAGVSSSMGQTGQASPKAKRTFYSLPLAFSSGTEASAVQNAVESALVPRGPGRLGPGLAAGGESGDPQDGGAGGGPQHHSLLVFVDDMNLPTRDSISGACPPLELITQLLSHGGWFSVKRGATF